jgi:hypothetical protein
MRRWHLRDIGGSVLERELAAMLGRWQQQVGVGTLLRRAACTLAHIAHSGARVKVGGGQRCLLWTALITGCAGQSWGGQWRLLRLHRLACSHW